MPSISDPALQPAARDYQVSVGRPGAPENAGVAKGIGNVQVLTVQRETESGKHQILAQITFDHSPAKPGPMSMDDMMIQLANLSASLQGQTVKISEGMLERNRDTIEQKNEARAKMFEKIERMERKMEKQQKSAEMWGWIGTTAAVLLTAASMGSLGPVAATCMVVGTGIGLGNQIATSAGAYEDLAKKDPKAAEAVSYTMMALQIAFSLAGMAAAANSAKTVAEGGAEIASQGAKTGANAAKIASESAETAAQAGSSMSGASSGSQMADDLVKGVSDMARTANKGQQFADDAVDAGQAAGQGAAKAGNSGKNAVDGASDGAASNSNIAQNLKDAKRVEDLHKVETGLSRVGHTLQITSATGKTVNDIDVAVLGHDTTDSRARLANIQKVMTFQLSLMNEITEALAQMYAEMQNAAKAPSETLSKLNTAKMASISNMGTSTGRTA